VENLLRRFTTREKGPISYLLDHGIAYQTDLTPSIHYDAKYIEGLRTYRKNMERLEAVNGARVSLVNCYAGESARVLDYGVGACDFIDRRPHTFGFDVCKESVLELRNRGKYSEEVSSFDAVCVWDVLEHMEHPERFLDKLKPGALLFVSIPVIKNMESLESWVHYKPGEHLYYFTAEGFLHYMTLHGFRALYTGWDEVQAGRRDILTAVLKKDMPTYREMIGMYAQMHEKRYGVSADDHLTQIARHVKALNPGSILDYGCGQAGFAKWFWNDGARSVAQYDPAIPAFRDMPERSFDLVLCCDVMEHIEMRHVSKVLGEIRAKSNHAIFTIATKPARARLPDGRNAHVTLLRPEEWRSWIEEYFGYADFEPTCHPKTVLIKTFTFD